MQRQPTDRRMQERRQSAQRSAVGRIMGQLPGPLALLNRFSITRYLVASIVSLAFDTSIFLTLVTFAIIPGYAAAVGYAAGILIHWMISSSFVFPGKAKQGGALYLQQLSFLATAVLGMAITVVTVSLMTGWGFLPIAAKGMAVFISFFTVYATRKYGVFR